MNTHWKNLLPLLWLVLGANSGGAKTMAARSGPEVPLMKVAIVVERNARDDFFEQMKRFADRHAFAIRIAPVRPDGEHFAIQMWREDLKAVGTNPFQTEAFTIYFYENDVPPVPAEHLDALISELKQYLRTVHGVSIPDSLQQ